MAHTMDVHTPCMNIKYLHICYICSVWLTYLFPAVMCEVALAVGFVLYICAKCWYICLFSIIMG